LNKNDKMDISLIYDRKDRIRTHELK